jgi:hypothetical protein
MIGTGRLSLFGTRSNAKILAEEGRQWSRRAIC